MKTLLEITEKMAAARETAVSLPALQTKVRFHKVPRRYEETKPVIMQDFTHRKIMNLGQEIHRRTLEQCGMEKEVAMRCAEEAVWAQADTIKREALERAERKAAVEHERAVKKLLKAQEKAIKEKALQVEGEMQRIMLEQVQETREEGERRLREAVAATEQRCHQELLAAVAAARQEEQLAAKQEAQRVAQQEQDKFNAAMRKAAEEKAEALANLKDQKDKEREEAVAHAHKVEQDIATEKLAKMETGYEERLTGLDEQIVGREGVIEELKGDIKALDREKKTVEMEMLALRADFQHFINSTQPFEKGKANYLISPVRSFELPGP